MNISILFALGLTVAVTLIFVIIILLMADNASNKNQGKQSGNNVYFTDEQFLENGGIIQHRFYGKEYISKK